MATEAAVAASDARSAAESAAPLQDLPAVSAAPAEMGKGSGLRNETLPMSTEALQRAPEHEVPPVANPHLQHAWPALWAPLMGEKGEGSGQGRTRAGWKVGTLWGNVIGLLLLWPVMLSRCACIAWVYFCIWPYIGHMVMCESRSVNGSRARCVLR